jgi:signal transduction histidine kinase
VSAARIRLYASVIIGGVALLFSVISIVLTRPDNVAGSLTWVCLGVLPVYVVAVWLVRQRPDHPQARRLLLVASSSAVGVAIEQVVQPRYQQGIDDWWLPWVNLLYDCTGTLTLIAAALLFATYPDGDVERRWQRITVHATWWLLAVPVLEFLSSPTVPVSRYFLDPPPVVPNPFAQEPLSPLAPGLHLLSYSYLGGVAAILMVLVRYHQASSEQRQRMRMLVYTLGLSLPVLIIPIVLRMLGVPDTSPVIRAIEALYIPFLLMIPICIVVGVMRYRLYEIDLIVRRSVVYGTLTVVIAAVYIAVAAAPGLALGNQIPVQVAVVLTILTAVAFQPLRRRLERLADRWVFGARVNRYQLLTDYGASLEQTISLADLLPRLAETVRQGLGAPWVRVSLPGSSTIAGKLGGPVELTVMLERPGEPHGMAWTRLGRIECGQKAEGYDTDDRELLTTLAGQAATVIANVRLTAELGERLDELERSRARIVAAQDLERRRIERNIHDGVQQELVAMMMKIRLARNQVGRGERTADDAFDELQRDTKELLADLRELAHGIHPPVLSDGGLVAAVEARAARLPFDVRLTTTPDLRSRRFAEDVEGAAYFVVCEALTNVVKHSAATQTEVTLSTADDRLSVQILDDGAGFAANGRAGSGLTNLRDRVEALGGRLNIETALGRGTTVLAELPCGPTPVLDG